MWTTVLQSYSKDFRKSTSKVIKIDRINSIIRDIYSSEMTAMIKNSSGGKRKHQSWIRSSFLCVMPKGDILKKKKKSFLSQHV